MEVYTANSIQDRTFEFQQAVNTFSRQEKAHHKEASSGKGNSGGKTEFNKQAGQIAKEIIRVTGALSKLAQLTKRKQLFGDKPTDIVELTYIIKQDIFRIEKELKSLKSLQVSGHRGKSNSGSDAQLNMYNKNVVQLLNTKTKNISENFKDVLQTRQRTEMLQRSRQEQLLAAVKSIRAAAKNMAGSVGSPGVGTSENPFLASLDLGTAAASGPGAASDANHDDYGGAMLSLPDQSQQLLLLEEQNNEYIQERSNAVDAIESTINEVGGLFQQLATMVQEQGEVIQRIDTNVEDVSLNIGGAQRELMKYYHNVSSNRWLMLKIFGVLIVFFLMWVLIS
ncbi:hypothetical protein PICMEDRAFT_47464 [Pichia membranifaciens NRRL Y-2026]|uniref:t-SNARE coiled-coil homology domain-containing protein n=1 Tax=Pichia membranifaciens NRRL Y-2026 TaxID=763406 RepID=A0A1E3NQN3_9ASCO|nr:hypothetical protein PICMEDRAFT_47464 [Pichia membranifaciens NRRL Y-2026]ODQ48420.1 hypothetical protein PICMEDRAFT_47464 [Pichia membranifaciens NRRL Y-2026]